MGAFFGINMRRNNNGSYDSNIITFSLKHDLPVQHIE